MSGRPNDLARFFLGWDRPALLAAADHLAGLARRDGPLLDLSQYALILPGAQAGRRLRDLLIERAESEGASLVPPMLCGVGQTPELLYEQKRPFASQLTQQLAWAETLRLCKPQQLKHLIPFPPSSDDLSQWREYGEIIRKTHRELASEKLDFAAVAKRAIEMPEFAEVDRWTTLAHLQQDYLARLDRVGVWDKETARLFALQYDECRCERKIVLIGTVDLNQTLRSMLDQAASHGAEVSALIAAPPELADSFDAHGCLKPDAWSDRRPAVDSSRVYLVEGPADQSEQAVACLANYAGRYAPEEVVIGVPDEALVPELKQRLAEHQLDSRFGPGSPVVETLPCRLLRTFSEYMRRRSFAALAEALRHPDVWRMIESERDPLETLDLFFGEHLRDALDATELEGETIADLMAQMDRLAMPLSQPVCPLVQWRQPISELLQSIYGDRELTPGSVDYRSIYLPIEAIQNAMATWEEIPDTLQPLMSASEAIDILLRPLRSELIPEEPRDGVIELLGWLELPLQDAPALILTSFNDGLTPSSANADLFLPNSLRERLGIEDNARRLARDAYAFELLLNSRQDLDVIVAKRTSAGDPLAPSRLLFGCDDKTLPAAVERMFGDPEPIENTAVQFQEGETELFRQAIEIPLPEPGPYQVDKITASDIRRYLFCPYRYYLEKILRLHSYSDSARELDAAQFGNLAHDSLEKFGRSEIRNSVDEKAIRDYLEQALSEIVKEKFGARVLPAVRIQVEQLRLRLQWFAGAQARRAEEGWKIYRTETNNDDHQPILMVDDVPVRLRGRIDRIDHHPDTNRWAVIDYKTADTAKKPEADHHKGKFEEREWFNVQLPFYRLIARELGIGQHVEVGYFTLPAKREDTRYRPAAWEDADFDQAEGVIAEVVRRIRRGEFWPPADVGQNSDDYSRICQDGVLGRWVLASEAEEVAP
ncbi:PD-(D/E)XK nuclease family protein [Blastopirellula sp. JC732]|uniref:PD-(D/E)XK nuclease family protein n=1 Tax=Blastopirellula sediminis TaxID=2894196 RepID=A0A9X1SF39_9BACT|nr:PD-(D/E)XK nuclease family protein [Blastopirellula sediminis]MCC9609355.1 PD-(D/E)XK nuclease family protein [Blastopirellula sediminis]MCC9627868.1 PD-(D/E)XK nuclease family protein [Blastopirellula sediminis]